MLIKSVLLFLLAMVAIGMIGGAITGRGPFTRLGRGPLSRLGRKRDRYCPSCGRPRIGHGPCACGRA
jgi:hypothetical protein